MRKYLLPAFDTLVYGGFGLFMVIELCNMPAELRRRLLAVSVDLASRLLG